MFLDKRRKENERVSLVSTKTVQQANSKDEKFRNDPDKRYWTLFVLGLILDQIY